MDPPNIITWILVCGISAGGVLCIKQDDRPVLTQLLQFQTRDRKPIRLLQDIVPHYATFGTCLLDDENGVKVHIIESNHRSVEEKTTAIFTKFIEGGGKKPISWATVVECLRTVELNYLADSIEELFEHDLPQPSSTPQPNGADPVNDDWLVKILTALDKAQSGQKGEIVVFGRTIRFKAKWRVHSIREPMVWDATALDVETGIEVKVKHKDTDKYANQLAVQKLCKELKSRGILQDVHDEL